MGLKSRGDVCLKCGETRGAIMNESLICWDGYDELGKHQFKQTRNDPAENPQSGFSTLR